MLTVPQHVTATIPSLHARSLRLLRISTTCYYLCSIHRLFPTTTTTSFSTGNYTFPTISTSVRCILLPHATFLTVHGSTTCTTSFKIFCWADFWFIFGLRSCHHRLPALPRRTTTPLFHRRHTYYYLHHFSPLTLNMPCTTHWVLDGSVGFFVDMVWFGWFSLVRGWWFGLVWMVWFFSSYTCTATPTTTTAPYRHLPTFSGWFSVLFCGWASGLGLFGTGLDWIPHLLTSLLTWFVQLVFGFLPHQQLTIATCSPATMLPPAIPACRPLSLPLYFTLPTCQFILLPSSSYQHAGS